MTGSGQPKYNNPLTATITGILDRFRKQIPSGKLNSTDRLDGKKVLIDGATSGLGFAIAVELAKRGADVIMACRSGIPEKGEKVKTLSGSAKVTMLHVDFSDIGSILKLASALDDHGPIDVYISNASIVSRHSRKTKQGLEEMFTVNYFSKFIFVNLLIKNKYFRDHDAIPRIIFVASETHRNPKRFEWDDFGIYKDYSIGKSITLYGYYKMLLVTFGAELSRRLNAGEMKYSVFLLCPGPVNTNIGREAPRIFHPLMKLVFSIFFRSPARAALPVIYLAASPDQEGKSFDYLFLMSRKEVDEKSMDAENGKRLWELTEKLAGSLGL